MVAEEKYIKVSGDIIEDLKSGSVFRPVSYVRNSNKELNEDLPFILERMADENQVTFDYDRLGKIEWSTVQLY